MITYNRSKECMMCVYIYIKRKRKGEKVIMRPTNKMVTTVIMYNHQLIWWYVALNLFLKKKWKNKYKRVFIRGRKGKKKKDRMMKRV